MLELLTLGSCQTTRPKDQIVSEVLLEVVAELDRTQ